MRPSQLLLFVILLYAIALKSTQALRPLICEVYDTTAGTPDTRFTNEVGVKYGAKVLLAATEFVLNTFGQNDTGGRVYNIVELYVESFRATGKHFAIATFSTSEIFVNADYLQKYPGNLTEEFTGIVYFMSGQVWQWTGNGGAPRGLQTGIPEYIRLTAGWGNEGLPPRGSGLRWDEGHAVTAYFLEYCEGLRPGFVSDLNAKMIDSYSDAYFVELLGKSVNELWDDYKKEYGSPAPAPARAAAPARATAPAPAPTFWG